MATERRISISTTMYGALGVLLLVALWFRITSLEKIPGHDGDESYLGIQVARMLQGEGFTLLTANRNLMDPFFLALQVPFQLVAKPSLWVLRAPSVLSGTLAVVLAFVLGARAVGRPTALVATALLAALPPAIVYSRIGHEYSQIPLVGVFAITFAFRAETLGLVSTLILGQLVHPTNIFLLPVVVPIYLTQIAQRETEDPARRRRVLLVVMTCVVVVGGIATYLLFQRPIVQQIVRLRPPMAWGVFVKGLEKFFLFDYKAIDGRAPGWIRWPIRLAVLVVFVFGLRQLLRLRQWDRLALLIGLAASLATFHALAGPGRLSLYATNRYGVVFIVPTVFAFACLFQALCAERSKAESSSEQFFHATRLTAIVATMAVLLLVVNIDWFSRFTKEKRESIWTFRTEERELFAQTLSLIQREAAENGTRSQPTVVLAENYWVSKPLEYLGSWEHALRVEQLEPTLNDWSGKPGAENPAEFMRREVIEKLRQGAFVCALWRTESPVKKAVLNGFPPERVQTWLVTDETNVTLVVYHLKSAESDPGQAIADLLE